jgi:hypothetical protein
VLEWVSQSQHRLNINFKFKSKIEKPMLQLKTETSKKLRKT